jgi:Fe2+ transport system protein FeoA
MRRREFITLIGGAATAFPLAARAQRAGEVPTIGYLGPNVESVDRPRIAAFAQRLGELGWVEDRSVIIVHREAGGLVERAVEIHRASRSLSSITLGRCAPGTHPQAISVGRCRPQRTYIEVWRHACASLPVRGSDRHRDAR